MRLARAVLRRDPIGLKELDDAPPGDFGPIEQLARRIDALDGEMFRQTFLPGQSARSLHRAALVFKMNLRDAQEPLERWLFPNEIVVVACQGNERVRRWQDFTSRPLVIREYPNQRIAGKDPHSSMMDDANTILFADDLSRMLDSYDADPGSRPSRAIDPP